MSERPIMNGKLVFTVPAKTVINFESHFDKKLLCDGMTFTTGSGCVYRCAFCYVPDMERKRGPWMRAHGVQYPADGHLGVVIRYEKPVDILRKQLLGVPETERQARKVIYSSPKVDVAGNMDLVRETVEICKTILELTNWDIRLLSKSNLLPKIAQELDDLWANKCELPRESEPHRRIIYGVSTGTLDDKLASAFEEGTPLVSKRIQSLHWLQDNGYRTFGMICPSLPQDDYSKFAKEMAAAIRVDRCEHVWAEVINLRGESFDRTLKALAKSGFQDDCRRLHHVSNDKTVWEAYARATFEAHAAVYAPKPISGIAVIHLGSANPIMIDAMVTEQTKLRFMQYVTKGTRDWWESRREKGAVVL